MKAVIVDVQGEYVAALCENGGIEKIPNNGYEIGQQIDMSASVIEKKSKNRKTISKFIRRAGTVAAVLVIAAGIGSGIAYAMPYGTVSLDSDASVEYTINCFNRVIGVKAANENGSTVLDAIDSSILNKDIEVAIAVTIEQIGTEGYLDKESELVISVGTKGENHSERLADKLGKMVESDMPVQAEIIPVTMNDVNKAHENDMTAGQKWRQENNKTEKNVKAEENIDIPEEPENVNDDNTGQGARDNEFNGTENPGNQGREEDGNNQTPPAETFDSGNQGSAPSQDGSGEYDHQDHGAERDEQRNVQSGPAAPKP